MNFWDIDDAFDKVILYWLGAVVLVLAPFPLYQHSVKLVVSIIMSFILITFLVITRFLVNIFKSLFEVKEELSELPCYVADMIKDTLNWRITIWFVAVSFWVLLGIFGIDGSFGTMLFISLMIGFFFIIAFLLWGIIKLVAEIQEEIELRKEKKNKRRLIK